ncbi:MAG: D-aminoacyl-tRNA deacylase [Patescibacteria group bacterium]
MKVVIQKSGQAKVKINGKTHSEIEEGLVILLGIKTGDTEKDIDYLVEKIINLRLFEEGEKHFEKSLLEKNKQALVISQFTLYGDCKKGRRPDFVLSARSEEAKPLYEKFLEKLSEKGIEVKSGIFGAMMDVHLINKGPITIILES